MDYQHKVSVIVPVYNIAGYVERCLQSIVSQSLNEIEIIVVNDGSTDESVDIIAQITKADPRVVVVNKLNGGLSSARNAGIAIANGEYLLHIDGDDWIEQDYLKDMYTCAQQNNLDVVISNYWKDFDNGSISKVVDLPIKDNKIIDGQRWLREFFGRKATQSMFNKLFRSSLYKNNAIEHPLEVSVGEDLATTPRLMYYAKRIGKLNKCYYHYIQRTTSLINSINRDSTDRNLTSLVSAFDRLRIFFSFDADVLKKISAHQTAQIAIFVFTPQVDQDSDFMNNLTDEYLRLNQKEKIAYSTKRFQIYSSILKVFPYKNVLRIIQNINKLASRVYG